MYTLLMKLQGYGTVILPCLLLQEQSTSALGACFYVTALDHLIGRSNHRSVYCGLHPNVRRRCRLSASILRNPTLEATGSPKIITLSQLSFRTFTTVGYLQRYVQLVLVLEMSLIICSALHRHGRLCISPDREESCGSSNRPKRKVKPRAFRVRST